jgi:hypothetical protein
MGEDKWTAKMKEAKNHVKVCIGLYKKQMSSGRLFLHEHPASASSWGMEEIVNVMKEHEVEAHVGNMCRFGMIMPVDDGVEKLVKEDTKFMSNSKEILKEVGLRCTNRIEWNHDHTVLMGGKAAAAAKYPPKLVSAILRGLRREKQKMMEENPLSVRSLDGKLHEESWDEGAGYFDDISGHKMDKNLVEEARAEELKEFERMQVWTIVPTSECHNTTGRGPIGTRWVDVNKGDTKAPDVRSRLVAQEFKDSPSLEMFAGTPPWEAKKILFSIMASRPHKNGKDLKVGLIDVKKAYLYAKSRKPTYIKLPEEFGAPPGMCGKLNVSLYGTRDAASNWEREYTETFQNMGLKQGLSSPCIFRSEEEDITVVVHGDDFTVLSDEIGIEKVRRAMESKYRIKMRGILGRGREDEKEIRLLNRIIRVTPAGVEIEADQRHAEIIIEQMKMTGAKGVTTPGVKTSASDSLGDKELSREEAREYRGMTARANYLAQDRVDIRYAVKELSKKMSSPTEHSWMAL